MFVSDDAKRVQVNMSRKLRDLLRDWAAEVSKERDAEVGMGTLAGELLEVLMNNPDLVHRLLKEVSAQSENASKKDHRQRSPTNTSAR